MIYSIICNCKERFRDDIWLFNSGFFVLEIYLEIKQFPDCFTRLFIATIIEMFSNFLFFLLYIKSAYTSQKKKNQPIAIDRASAGFLLLVDGSQYKYRFSSFLFVKMVQNSSTTNNSNNNKDEKRRESKRWRQKKKKEMKRVRWS